MSVAAQIAKKIANMWSEKYVVIMPATLQMLEKGKLGKMDLTHSSRLSFCKN
jgi:hypothetical protein